MEGFEKKSKKSKKNNNNIIKMPVASNLKIFADALFNIFASFDSAVQINQAEIFRIINADSELFWENKYKLLEEG